MPEYDPNSLNAVLSRIETKLSAHALAFDTHVTSTQVYRKELDEKLGKVSGRVTELEGDKKKLIGIATGAGIGAAGIGHAVLKLFGGGGGSAQ